MAWTWAPCWWSFLATGVGDGAAHAAADDGHLFQALRLGGAAQGAHEVVKAIALLQVVEQLGGGPHDLEDDGDGALLPVKVGDGQGDALPVLVDPEDDELARLRLFGDEGGVDDHPGDGGVQRLFFQYEIHSH